MSEQQNNNAWIDVAISCLVVVIVLFSAWNTIATIRINKQMEMNKAHLCVITDFMFGPVPPESQEELCDQLREDIYNTWQDRQKANNE
ncbi:MAG: hypothetical protein QF704_00480 [Anaerolineales bacterium]|jgi:hypothetical protein|nr:hypothetical protein [Anaerolineales bacterium]